MNAIVRADAFRLPFRDASFSVVVADPPYEGKVRGKKGIGYRPSGYRPFAGRTWWHEAWRVLRPSGHLYVVSPIKELRFWLNDFEPEGVVDILSWVSPNSPALSAFWRRGVGGRSPSWRPIVHWQPAPRFLINWTIPDGGEHPINGRPLNNTAVFVDPNVCVAPLILRTMREAEPWPNQLPLKLLRYMLRPHKDARILDLFSGSGTCRTAAISFGLDVVSVDLAPEALDIVQRRPAQTSLVR